MKIKYLLMSALACMALLSCQKENSTPDNGGKEDSDGKDYMSVRFTMSGNSTRADGDFVAGDAAEVAVSQVRFLFFGSDGKQVADPYDLTSGAFSWTDGTGSIDKKSGAAILVLSNKTANPASIVAIANLDGTMLTNLTKSLTMDGLKTLYGNWADAAHTTSGNFVMANAVYQNGSAIQIGAPVTDSDIFSTATAAQAHPVTISMEKNVAKIHVVKSGNWGDTSEKLGDKSIVFEAEKWWIDHDPDLATLVKPLSAGYSWSDWSGTFTWNDPTNFRSYWAAQFALPSQGKYLHRAVNDGKALDAYAYTNENATTAANSDNATRILVQGSLKVDGAATSLVLWQSGIYKQSDFETILANRLSWIYKKDGTPASGEAQKYKSVEKSDLTFTYNSNDNDNKITLGGVEIENYESTVTVAFASLGEGSLFKRNLDGTATALSAAEISSALEEVHVKFPFYKEGRTYYFFNVVHNKAYTYKTDTAEEHPLYGVIRNHLYEISLTGVMGLGTPLPQDDSFDVVPQPVVDKNSYIAAEINILKYKEVDQEVVLGK